MPRVAARVIGEDDKTQEWRSGSTRNSSADCRCGESGCVGLRHHVSQRRLRALQVEVGEPGRELAQASSRSKSRVSVGSSSHIRSLKHSSLKRSTKLFCIGLPGTMNFGAARDRRSSTSETQQTWHHHQRSRHAVHLQRHAGLAERRRVERKRWSSANWSWQRKSGQNSADSCCATLSMRGTQTLQCGRLPELPSTRSNPDPDHTDRASAK